MSKHSIPLKREQILTVPKSAQSPFALSPIAAAIRTSILSLSLGLLHSTSNAATISVDSNLDDGINCTLRKAIDSINNLELEDNCEISPGTGSFGQDDTVDFDTVSFGSNTITLNGSQLLIESDITIDGGGDIVIDGDSSSRVFYMNNADVTLNSLTVANGYAAASINYGDSDGGGILFLGSNTITINSSTVTGNTASGHGGGIFVGSNAATIITQSDISYNRADGRGGGLYLYKDNGQDVKLSTITQSEISNNTIAGSGGTGIHIHSRPGSANPTNSMVSIESSTIASNRAFYYGGAGIFARNYANVSVNNSTVSDSYSYYRGGGIYALDNASISITNSTISGSDSWNGNALGISTYRGASIDVTNSTISNTSSSRRVGRGISANGLGSSVTVLNSTITDTKGWNYSEGVSTTSNGHITILNSIVSDSVSSFQNGVDCNTWSGGTITPDTASIIKDGSCGSVSGDPGIGPLADNGGPTLTHALNSNSIARNAGNNGICPNKDQRGEVRNDIGCDVGAVESPDDTDFFAIPLGKGKTVLIPL